MVEVSRTEKRYSIIEESLTRGNMSLLQLSLHFTAPPPLHTHTHTIDNKKKVYYRHVILKQILV